MWFTKFIVDVVITVAILTAIPGMIGTLIDLTRKLAKNATAGIRKAFKLDEEELN